MEKIEYSKSEYFKLKLKRKIIFLFVFMCLIACFLISFNIGRFPVNPITVGKVLLSKVFAIDISAIPEEVPLIIFEIRLPRIVGAIIVGAALSLSGLVFQALFKNPMVSPDILGATSGAGFGAALALFFSYSYTMVSFMAFGFGILAVILTYMIGRKFRGDQILGLILAGIMVGSMFKASISLLKLVADTDNTLPAITYWLMGSMSGIGYEELKMAVVPILIGMIPMFLLKWRLNIFTASDEEAAGLGVNTKLLRLIAIVCATLMTTAAVSITGIIGWVGLVIPHLCRLAIGHDHKFLVPMCSMVGAIFLLMVDNFARSLFTMEIPIGILTSFIGVPFFLIFFLRGSER